MANLDERDWDLIEGDEMEYDEFGERIPRGADNADEDLDLAETDELPDDDIAEGGAAVTAEQAAGQRHVSDFRETLDKTDHVGDAELMDEAEEDNRGEASDEDGDIPTA